MADRDKNEDRYREEMSNLRKRMEETANFIPREAAVKHFRHIPKFYLSGGKNETRIT